jgi:hypothetical protein
MTWTLLEPMLSMHRMPGPCLLIAACRLWRIRHKRQSACQALPPCVLP